MHGRAGGRPEAARRPRHDGSAVAEFVLVSGLVLALAMGVFQLGLVLYVRNTLTSCASEGARLAARADASLADGAARTSDLVTRGLSPAYAREIHVDIATTSAGVRVVEVTVRAPMPVVGLLGPTGALSATGRAFLETQ